LFLRFTPCGLFEFHSGPRFCSTLLIGMGLILRSEHTCSTPWHVGWFLAWAVRRRSLPFLLSLSWYQTINALVWTMKEDEPRFLHKQMFYYPLNNTYPTSKPCIPHNECRHDYEGLEVLHTFMVRSTMKVSVTLSRKK
jgi:hypothetical protein